MMPELAPLCPASNESLADCPEIPSVLRFFGIDKATFRR